MQHFLSFINVLAYLFAILSSLWIVIWFLPDTPKLKMDIALGRATISYKKLFTAIGILIVSLAWIYTNK